MLSRANNFVFVHIPRTGGNSLQTTLEACSEDRRVRRQDFQDLVNTFEVTGEVTERKHFTSEEYIDRLGPEAFLRLKKVTLVRHPQDRAMSFYFAPFRWHGHSARPGDVEAGFDKEEFLRLLPAIGTATQYLSHRGELIAFDVVGRFENYAADFARILQACGVTHPATRPHVNTRVVHPEVRWDHEMLEAVAGLFADDFRNFGYQLRR